MCRAFIPLVIGAAMSYQGQRQQKHEYQRAKQADEFYEAQRQAALLRQRRENEDLSRQRNNAVVSEAREVSPIRHEQIQQAESVQTQSNVKALQDLNALGSQSIAQYSDGNHSESYLKARAEAAAKQTERAIALAGLFASQSAPNSVLLAQRNNALPHKTEQGLIGARHSSYNRGYDVLFGNMNSLRNKATRINTNKGQAAQALGGALMQYGMGQMGQGAGSYFGKKQANESIKNNLF